ncbi:MAG TPA: hypothetical protein VNZ64_08660 [Candidatus Acidoferrum sp.]|jgi:hypothetical protein|nr:hypothetical protein [Candidatus Acidoferrum sp.]
MKSSTQLSSKVPGAQIQYAHALTELEAEANPLMPMARIRAFRMSWTPLKSDAPPSSLCLAPVDNSPGERSSAVRVDTPATETRTESLALSGEGSPAHFELVLEEIRQRRETKTTLLEEGLLRSERSQGRFWGINE